VPYIPSDSPDESLRRFVLSLNASKAGEYINLKSSTIRQIREDALESVGSLHTQTALTETAATHAVAYLIIDPIDFPSAIWLVCIQISERNHLRPMPLGAPCHGEPMLHCAR
jgi:hypothetical protein